MYLKFCLSISTEKSEPAESLSCILCTQQHRSPSSALLPAKHLQHSGALKTKPEKKKKQKFCATDKKMVFVRT